MQIPVRQLVLGVVFVVSARAAWPAAVSSTAQTGPYTISRVVAARSVEKGKPGGIAAPRDLVVRSEWYIDDAHVTDASYDLTIKKGADFGYISLALPPGTPFPEGAYRVDLTVQDLVLATHKFEVRAGAASVSQSQSSGGTTAPATGSSSPASPARPPADTAAPKQ